MQQNSKPLFSENSIVPFYGALWLSLVVGFELFFLLTPASGGDLLAKVCILLLGGGFFYIGVWLVQKPSRYEIFFENGDLIIRLVQLIGDGTEWRIHSSLISEVRVDVSENSEGVIQHRVLIETSQGIVHDVLPSLTADRAEHARHVLAEFIGRGS